MEKIKLLAVAPYSGLNELISEVAGRYPELEVETLDGNLDIAVEQLSKVTISQYDAIISRGATASTIAKLVSIPVVDIGITVYDFMRAIKLAQNFSGKCAIVGFPSITEMAEKVIRDFTFSHAGIFTIHEREEIGALYQNLLARGYRTVIGDVFACDSAKSTSMNTVLLVSGKEGVIKVLEQTIHLCSCLQKSQFQLKLLSEASYRCEEKVVVLQADRKILHSSLPLSHLTHENLMQMLDATPDGASQLLTFHDYTYHVRRCDSIVQGQTLTFFYIRRLRQRVEQSHYLRIANAHSAPHDLESSAAFRSYLQPLLRQTEVLNAYDLPVFISGSDGTGKDALAYLIHAASRHSLSPFLTLDCAAVPAARWQNASSFVDNLTGAAPAPTLYLKNISMIPVECQPELAEAAQKIIAGGLRILLSAEESAPQLLRRYLQLRVQLQTLTEHQIRIPDLTECTAQLQEFVAICINEANLSYGKQITSVSEDALALLSSYSWPGNISQLHRVIGNLVLAERGSIISAASVDAALQDEAKSYHSAPSQINTNYTLREATLNYIRLVLTEEKGSYSRAAARLGISRSTLWRKLQDE